MREIHPNKTYKHFKGNVYKVLYIGYDAERENKNGDAPKVVIYESSHDKKVWVRDYDNFASKVDNKKYPNASQEYRFEQVD